MNEAQQKDLLRVARDTVRAVVTGQALPKPQSGDPALTALCGCFVTLKNHKRLRGCIGQFTSDKPLIELVVEMAKASASSDPRFLADPIAPASGLVARVLGEDGRSAQPASWDRWNLHQERVLLRVLPSPGGDGDRLEQGGVPFVLLLSQGWTATRCVEGPEDTGPSLHRRGVWGRIPGPVKAYTVPIAADWVLIGAFMGPSWACCLHFGRKMVGDLVYFVRLSR